MVVRVTSAYLSLATSGDDPASQITLHGLGGADSIPVKFAPASFRNGESKMKPFRYCALLFLFHLAAVQDSKVVRHQFGAVTVSAVDSFGRPRADCKVAEFRSMDDEEVDYVDRLMGSPDTIFPSGIAIAFT